MCDETAQDVYTPGTMPGRALWYGQAKISTLFACTASAVRAILEQNEFDVTK